MSLELEKRWEEGGKRLFQEGLPACNVCSTRLFCVCMWVVKCKWCARVPPLIVTFRALTDFLPLFRIYLASIREYESGQGGEIKIKQVCGYFFHSRHLRFTKFYVSSKLIYFMK